MVKKQKTKAVEHSISRDYFSKAQDFYSAVQLCIDNMNWNAAGLNAVHCAISVTDSLLAKYGGIRSVDSNHNTVADLLPVYLTNADTQKQAARLRKILDKKNLIEYEGRNFYQSEAENLQRDIDSYFNWAKFLINK